MWYPHVTAKMGSSSVPAPGGRIKLHLPVSAIPGLVTPGTPETSSEYTLILQAKEAEGGMLSTADLYFISERSSSHAFDLVQQSSTWWKHRFQELFGEPLGVSVDKEVSLLTLVPCAVDLPSVLISINN